MAKTPGPTVHRLPMTQARINLGQLARRAHVNNEYFILEKDGIPVIGIMDADELEDYLELRDPNVAAAIAESHAEYSERKGRPAVELIAELKALAHKQPRGRSRRTR